MAAVRLTDRKECREMLQRIREAVLRGDQERTGKLVESALAEGIEPSSLLNEGLIPAMDVVGQEYEAGIRFLPEMLISAEAMKEAMKILRPILAEAGVAARGRVVLGTVQGDLHDIGKDLVGMMLEGAGFEVIDLGTEVGSEQFVESVREHRPDIVGMSALLTTTMIYMPGVVEALERAGLREAVRIVVGGAPITQEYADAIGVDGYAADAPGAVALVRRLLA
jgi:5-methyltetrahydrofolate--homocysteine methyltransferase